MMGDALPMSCNASRGSVTVPPPGAADIRAIAAAGAALAVNATADAGITREVFNAVIPGVAEAPDAGSNPANKAMKLPASGKPASPVMAPASAPTPRPISAPSPKPVPAPPPKAPKVPAKLN